MTDAPTPRAGLDKPWGHELIWAQTDRYVGKILVIEAGKRLSLQKHVVKDESILVLRGRLRLYLEDDDGVVRIRELGPGEAPPCPRRPIHRYEAVERTRAGRGLHPRARRRRPDRGRLRARGHERALTGRTLGPGSLGRSGG